MSERIDDGFKTTVDFANIPSPLFWEKTVTPPGISGGGANDVTTMRSTRWRQMASKKLVTLTAFTIVCAYDPAIYEDIVAQMQINQEVTINFPDGSTVVFWGFIDEFTPGENTEGAQPTATITVIPSNQDDTQAEVAPVYTAAA